MSWAEIVIALATVTGPIFAVQIQKYLETWRDKRARRLQIFRTLMATRAMMIAPEHVQALNSIPIDFYGKSKITDKWEEYIEILGQDQGNLDIWHQNSLMRFTELLDLISRNLGYKFKITEMKKIYFPKGHGQIEDDLNTIRGGLARVLSGVEPIKMAVVEIPASPELNALQADLLVKSASAYGDGVLRVQITNQN